MENKEYAIAYKEVFEILKYIPKADYEKIPSEKLNLYSSMQEKEYNFKYDPSQTLDEQNVSRRAKAIIGLLYRDYWATEKQREKILAFQNQERIRLEEKKVEKYKVEDIFNDGVTYKNPEKTALVEVKKEKWYERIIIFFRKL